MAIPPKEGSKGCSALYIKLDCIALDLLAEYCIPSGKVHDKYCQHEIASPNRQELHYHAGIVELPHHCSGEHEIVEPTGAKHPKFFGRSGGVGDGSENSDEVISCNSS